jgi:hypothetical protein
LFRTSRDPLVLLEGQVRLLDVMTSFRLPLQARGRAWSSSLTEGASIAELAAGMGWAPSSAVAMWMRYGHLFAARDELS